MVERQGMLTIDELSDLAKSGEVETVLTVFTDLYGRFMGKRMDVLFFLDSVAGNGTHVCDYLLTVDMEMQPVPGYGFANWSKGYGDVHLVPDMATLRFAAWLDRTAMVICDVMEKESAEEEKHQLLALAPRTMLKKQTEALLAAGYSAMAGSELEYYMFNNDYREASDLNYHDLEAAGWYIGDYNSLQGSRVEHLNALARRNLNRSGVPVESSKGEWGVGQHELNVQHADMLTMADSQAIYKACLKETAESLGLSVTFMAKYDSDQAGSSCHVHISLQQKGRNAFAGESGSGLESVSDTFRWFLGGWIAHIPEMMVMYAPTINSYKRYQAGSWAPTRLAWSRDNRTAGFRVVGTGESLRIECRIPGADCNPYLVYAAAIASGMDGIANKIEPPEHFSGNVYEAKEIPHVPKTLHEATALFEDSRFSKETFGASVVEHYSHFFRTEQAAWDAAVTDWERRRYFERI